jgi:AcrR family transcriptional regulator
MKMTTNRYHHGNLKSDLLSAGLELARRSGFEAISLRELARDTKVTPAAALRHFSDLSHLKAEISQEARQELARLCLKDWEPLETSKLTKSSAIAKFDALGRRYVRFAKDNVNLFNSAFALCDANPAKQDDPSPWSLLEGVVEDLVSLGVIDKKLRLEAPLIAWSLVHGLSTLQSHNLVHVSKFQGDTEALVVRALHAALFTA